MSQEMFMGLGVLQSVDFGGQFFDGGNQQRDDIGVCNTKFLRIRRIDSFRKNRLDILSDKERLARVVLVELELSDDRSQRTNLSNGVADWLNDVLQTLIRGRSPRSCGSSVEVNTSRSTTWL